MRLHEFVEKVHYAVVPWSHLDQPDRQGKTVAAVARVQPVRIPNRAALQSIGESLRTTDKTLVLEYRVLGIPTELDDFGSRTDRELESLEIIALRPSQDDVKPPAGDSVVSVHLFGQPVSGPSGKYFARIVTYRDIGVNDGDNVLRPIKDAIDRETKSVNRIRRRWRFPVLRNVTGDDARSHKRDTRIRWQSAGISLGVAIAAVLVKWAVTGTPA